jgi:hypothetical protein
MVRSEASQTPSSSRVATTSAGAVSPEPLAGQHLPDAVALGIRQGPRRAGTSRRRGGVGGRRRRYNLAGEIPNAWQVWPAPRSGATVEIAAIRSRSARRRWPGRAGSRGVRKCIHAAPGTPGHCRARHLDAPSPADGRVAPTKPRPLPRTAAATRTTPRHLPTGTAERCPCAWALPADGTISAGQFIDRDLPEWWDARHARRMYNPTTSTFASHPDPQGRLRRQGPAAALPRRPRSRTGVQ